ncbi:MAG TPA: hypothetical protein PLE19_12760 [Planctomycetota bacterium]|nr:hypothetical protein [Planctomycetota bacterium]HRT95762.1 hypothetical protein [Planctomycetota bacterium]
MGDTLFQAGDVVCEVGTLLLGRAIAWATRGRREAKTVCTHVGRMVDPTTIAEAGLRYKVHAFDPTRRVRVFRYRPGLPDAARDCMWHKAWEYVDRVYGFLKLGLHLADGVLEKVLPVKHVYLFRRLCMTDYPICSWDVAWAYDECAGVRFGVPPRAATPDDILDWLEAHPEDWECVYDNTGSA